MTARILIVEDERDLAGLIADFVIAAGYQAQIIDDGARALTEIRRAVPDLVVLDIQLPGLDGTALCQAVRGFSDVPIIIVTARVTEIDRLLGLALGADDYVCKPFSPRELVARIQAILRRRTVPARGLSLDPATRSVYVHGHRVDLTPTEFQLLATLSARPGVIYTRAQLLDQVHRDALDIADRAIDTHIKNLRRKLAAAAPEVEMIESVYGLGYRYAG